MGGGRYPRGFPDPVGWILAEYGIKRSHGDLIQTIFHVFGLKNLVLSSLCTRHREADAGRAGPADSRKVWACWFSSPLIFTHPRLLPCRCRGMIDLAFSEYSADLSSSRTKQIKTATDQGVSQGAQGAQGGPRGPRCASWARNPHPPNI